MHITLYKDVNKKIIIEFNGVVGFEMTCCDFWGKSHYILDFEYIHESDEKLMSKLIDKGKEYLSQSSCFDLKEDHIETCFTLSSGDTFSIVCNYINFKEKTHNTGDGSVC